MKRSENGNMIISVGMVMGMALTMPIEQDDGALRGRTHSVILLSGIIEVVQFI